MIAAGRRTIVATSAKAATAKIALAPEPPCQNFGMAGGVVVGANTVIQSTSMADGFVGHAGATEHHACCWRSRVIDTLGTAPWS